MTYAPTESTYTKVTCSDIDGLIQLAEWVNEGNNLNGVTIMQSADISVKTITTSIGNTDNTFQGVNDGNNKKIFELDSPGMICGCPTYSATDTNISTGCFVNGQEYFTLVNCLNAWVNWKDPQNELYKAWKLVDEIYELIDR